MLMTIGAIVAVLLSLKAYNIAVQALAIASHALALAQNPPEQTLTLEYRHPSVSEPSLNLLLETVADSPENLNRYWRN